jgi:hypothetical protein
MSCDSKWRVCSEIAPDVPVGMALEQRVPIERRQLRRARADAARNAAHRKLEEQLRSPWQLTAQEFARARLTLRLLNVEAEIAEHRAARIRDSRATREKRRNELRTYRELLAALEQPPDERDPRCAYDIGCEYRLHQILVGEAVKDGREIPQHVLDEYRLLTGGGGEAGQTPAPGVPTGMAAVPPQPEESIPCPHCQGEGVTWQPAGWGEGVRASCPLCCGAKWVIPRGGDGFTRYEPDFARGGREREAGITEGSGGADGVQDGRGDSPARTGRV